VPIWPSAGGDDGSFANVGHRQDENANAAIWLDRRW
jgi:hypothetical protein